MTGGPPRGWERSPLPSLAEINPPNPDQLPEDAQEVSFVPMAAVGAGSGRLDPQERRVWAEVKKGYKRFQDGDVLIAKITPCMENGKFAVARNLINGIGAGSTEFHVLRPRNGTSPDLVRYYLSQESIRREARASMTGTAGQLRVPQSYLEALEIPLPTATSDQESLVKALDSYFSRLDEVEAGLERVQRNLKRYRASVLQAAVTGRLVPTEAELARAEGREYEPASSLLKRWQLPSPHSGRKGRFWGAGAPPRLTADEEASIPEGWCWTKVRSLGVEPGTAVQVGPMSMRSEDFAESGVPVFTVGSVQWASFDEARLRYLPENQASSFERYRILPGDVLFTRSGTIGRSAVASTRHAHFLMTFHLLRVRADVRKCNPHYLQMVFEGASHLRRQARGGAIGSTRAGFNTNLLGELDVPLPPRTEQERIVAQAEALLSDGAAVEAITRSSRARIPRLRQATLHAAFAGVLARVDNAWSGESRDRAATPRQSA